MTYNEAIQFLQSYQPMPDMERDVTPEEAAKEETLIGQWGKILEFFMDNPSEEAIPLFINSLGDPSGLGFYQRLNAYLNLFPENVKLPYILEALHSPSAVIRAKAALDFSIDTDSNDPKLIQALLNALNDSDVDVRLGAATTLNYKAETKLFDWRSYETTLQNAYELETEEDVKELYEELFSL